MENGINQQSQTDKVYYAYSTPFIETLEMDYSKEEGIHFVETREFIDRATVALRIKGNCFEYGIAICSKHDNFNKQKGRELALERLEQGFGSKCFDNTIFSVLIEKGDEVEKRSAAIQYLLRLVKSTEQRMEKYKRKVEEFNRNKALGVPAKKELVESPVPEVEKLKEPRKGFLSAVFPTHGH